MAGVRPHHASLLFVLRSFHPVVNGGCGDRAEYLATVTRSAYAPTQGRMPPGRVGAALWSFFVGVLCMGAYVGLGTHFPPTALVGKEMQDTSLVAL